jgi:hypothetical protein
MAVLDLGGVDLEIQPEKPRLGDVRDSYADISKARVNLRETSKALV